MSDTIDKELSVNRDVDALKAILNAGIPGAPVLSAFLQAALNAIESEGNFPDFVDPVNHLSDKKPEQPKARKGNSLDSLGGGNIL